MTDIPTDKQLDELDQAILDCMPNKQTGLYDVLTFRARVHGYIAQAVLAELKLALHDTGGSSDARWTFENVKDRIAAIEQELNQ